VAEANEKQQNHVFSGWGMSTHPSKLLNNYQWCCWNDLQQRNV